MWLLTISINTYFDTHTDANIYIFLFFFLVVSTRNQQIKKRKNERSRRRRRRKKEKAGEEGKVGKWQMVMDLAVRRM